MALLSILYRIGRLQFFKLLGMRFCLKKIGKMGNSKECDGKLEFNLKNAVGNQVLFPSDRQPSKNVAVSLSLKALINIQPTYLCKIWKK